MIHRMILNQTSYFGAGAISVLPQELAARGFTKALVVTDKVLIDTGTAGKVTALLDQAGFAYEVFSDIAPNPPVENVKAGLLAFEAAGADCLIAVGGGSPQDTCKAIGIIAANPEYSDVLSLEGVAATKNPAVPIIAIPTTAGTAAEVTINYVITDTHNHRKFVCVDPHDIPVLAIVDAEMMAGMPRALKVATGLDALTHAIEGYTTQGAWELTDMMHLTAIEMIARALPGSVDGNLEDGERMALAQYIAGMGFSNVGLGIVHAMAHPLGGFYSTPHGVANGVLLAAVMEYNAPATGEKFRHIARAMGVKGTDEMSIEQARAAAVAAVRALCKELDNPTSLREIGAKEEDLHALAQAAFADVCAGGNPREATVEDIEAIYRSVF